MTRLTRLAPVLAALATASCLVPVSVPTEPTASPTPTPLAPGAMPQGRLPGALGSLMRTGPESLSMNLGESQPLAPHFRKVASQGVALAPTEGVVWTSSDEAIVSINPTTGVARAVAKGTAVINVALSDDPAVKAQITVNVGDGLGVQNVRLTPSEGKVVKGKTLKLQAEVVLGSGEIRSDVDWSTSDPAIATVAEDGTVTGVAPGLVQVLAAWKADPAFKGQAPVRVVATEDDLYLPVIDPTASEAEGPVDPEPGTWVDQISGVSANLDYVRFFDASRGVAAGQGALLSTTDGGATWAAAPAHDALAQPLGFDFQGMDAGWVVTRQKIFATTAAGDAFTPVVDFEATYGQEIAAFQRQGAGKAWVLTSLGAIYATTDGGQSWQEAVPAATAYRVAAYNFKDYKEYGPFAVTDGGMFFQQTHVYTVKHPTSNSYYDKVDRSLRFDAGAGWTSAALSARLDALAFPTAQEGWRLAGGLERSVDGGKTWVRANPGGTLPLRWIAAEDARTVRVGGAQGYVGTHDGGRSWFVKGHSGFDSRALFALDDAHMWAVGENGKIKRYVLAP